MTFFTKRNIIIGLIIIIALGILYYFYRQNSNKSNQLQMGGLSVGDPTKKKENNLPIPLNNEIIEQDNKKEEVKMDKTGNIYPFFDVFIGDDFAGRITFELIDDVAPKTCQNFRYLCSKGFNSEEPAYQNTIFHRIIKDFMIQGGDFTNHNGTGGYSIYGDKFDDESFELKHNQPGMLSMANSGPNSNGSQFFITTKEAPHLDGKHVVFGIIRTGFDVIEKLNNVNTDENDKPILKCKIARSGLTK